MSKPVVVLEFDAVCLHGKIVQVLHSKPLTGEQIIDIQVFTFGIAPNLGYRCIDLLLQRFIDHRREPLRATEHRRRCQLPTRSRIYDDRFRSARGVRSRSIHSQFDRQQAIRVVQDFEICFFQPLDLMAASILRDSAGVAAFTFGWSIVKVFLKSAIGFGLVYVIFRPETETVWADTVTEIDIRIDATIYAFFMTGSSIRACPALQIYIAVSKQDPAAV